MSKYDEFINRYRINSININRDKGYRNIDYYNKTASYYDNREEMVDIEMPRYAFEKLVDWDSYADETHDKLRQEACMRREHPAIAEAYDKYRMLLELYK
jgi:hypothetical protein